MNIKIKKHLLLYKGYKLKCAFGKSGIVNSKKEGDLATPKGIFKLGQLYFRKDRNKILNLENMNLGEEKEIGPSDTIGGPGELEAGTMLRIM